MNKEKLLINQNTEMSSSSDSLRNSQRICDNDNCEHDLLYRPTNDEYVLQPQSCSPSKCPISPYKEHADELFSQDPPQSFAEPNENVPLQVMQIEDDNVKSLYVFFVYFIYETRLNIETIHPYS